MKHHAKDNTIADVAVGDSAELTWHVTHEEISAFAALSGDYNTLHVDPKYAFSVGFNAQVVHGFLVGAKISGLLGMQLPGRRCLLLDQSLSYPNPLYPDDRATIRLEIQSIHEDMAVIKLKVSIVKDIPEAGKSVKVARGQITCKILS